MIVLLKDVQVCDAHRLSTLKMRSHYCDEEGDIIETEHMMNSLFKRVSIVTYTIAIF